MRIVSPQEMMQIETLALEKYGMTRPLLVESFGLRAAEFLFEKFLKQQSFGEIVVLVGHGGNGTDGLNVARHLSNLGLSVRAFLLDAENEWAMNAEQKMFWDMALAFGVKTTEIKSIEPLYSYFSETQEEYFVIDAIFGLGVRHPLSEFVSDVISLANEAATVMVSIDIPSGVMGETGSVPGTAINATWTLAVGLPKLGHFIAGGSHYKGKLKIISTGLPQTLLEGGENILMGRRMFSSDFSQRDLFAHKKSFGHCLIIGGSTGQTGSVQLAAMASLKVGAGNVSAVTWEKDYMELVSRAIPEMVIGHIPDNRNAGEQILKTLGRYDSIVIGPGLGRGERTREIVLRVLGSYNGPVLIDADAINALSLKEDGNFLATRQAPTLLTPHIGEFARFVGVKSEDILESPIMHLRQLVDQIRCSVLLKGACSIAAFTSGELYFNDFPNDGMATGGAGHVLAGVIGGMAAQKGGEHIPGYHRKELKNFEEAICLGLFVHTLAGKHAALKLGKRAMTATSIIDHLTDAFFELEEVRDKEVENLGQYQSF